MKIDLDLLREAFQHALTCPLAQDCYPVMRDEPEKITACDECRRMLIVWRTQVLEKRKAEIVEKLR